MSGRLNRRGIHIRTFPGIPLIRRLLLKAHGQPPPRPPSDPLDQLVATILSQHTTDVNSDRAFANLKERFPSWERVLKAGPGAVARQIRCGGLSRIKSRRIIGVLRSIRQQEGSLSLRRVASVPVEEALSYLTGLTGVGIKTACCVLLFAWNRPVMPVDTHIYRVSRRLGWLGEDVPVSRAHEALQKLISDRHRYDMHLLLIQHGRVTCHARHPACGECVLAVHCPSVHRTRSPRDSAPSKD
jgi:endonuclease III